MVATGTPPAGDFVTTGRVALVPSPVVVPQGISAANAAPSPAVNEFDPAFDNVLTLAGHHAARHAIGGAPSSGGAAGSGATAGTGSTGPTPFNPPQATPPGPAQSSTADELQAVANTPTNATTSLSNSAAPAATPTHALAKSAGSTTTPKPVLFDNWAPKSKKSGATPGGSASPGGFSSPFGTWVLDANKDETLFQNVPYQDFSTWAVDLRAQIAGATITSYSWDVGLAPDAIGVSGSSTYRLQFNWASFTGAPRTETIGLFALDSLGGVHSETLTFVVNGTDSRAWTASSPTTAQTLPLLIGPDQLQQGGDTISGPNFSVNLTSGDLNLGYSLPSYNPALTPLGLGYSSARADQADVFLENYALDPTLSTAPNTVSAILTLNGIPFPVSYNTTQLNPGDIEQIAVPVDVSTFTTGRYAYTMAVTANYGGLPVTTTTSGSVDIVNGAASDFAPGWTLSGLTRLDPVSGGVILDNGDGTSLWFASAGGSSYTTPVGDYSTLTGGAGGYTRTLHDGTQISYDSTGKQTAVTDLNGLTTSFAYNTSGQLTGITDPESQSVAIGYSGGRAVSITDPAGRATHLAYDTSGRLTGVTDPDTYATLYGYDGTTNRLTAATDPDTNTTGFTYSGQKIATYSLPGTPAVSIIPAQLQALSSTGILAVDTPAVYTDARGNLWSGGTDWLGFGTINEYVDGTGYVSLAYRDNAALPWLTTNNLGQRTRTFFDSFANPLKTVLPDDNYETDQFNSYGDVTLATDPNGYMQVTATTATTTKRA